MSDEAIPNGIAKACQVTGRYVVPWTFVTKHSNPQSSEENAIEGLNFFT